MKVAITGSTGLIGTALCQRLSERGDQVVRVVRGRLGSNEPTIDWNPAAGALDAGALEGFDAVVNLAGENIGARRWSDHQRDSIYRSRVDGTRLLAETLASLRSKPRVFLNASAIGYYGDRGDEVLAESSPPGDLFTSQVSAAAESAARAATDAAIRTVLMRTGIVLSARGGALARMLTLFSLGLGGRMGTGAQWMSWIAIDDEVAAIESILDGDLAGPVNLVAPNPVTNAQFTRALGKVLGRPALIPVPAFAPRLLLGRQLADELLFASARVEPFALETSGFSFGYASIEDGLHHVLRR